MEMDNDRACGEGGRVGPPLPSAHDAGATGVDDDRACGEGGRVGAPYLRLIPELETAERGARHADAFASSRSVAVSGSPDQSHSVHFALPFVATTIRPPHAGQGCFSGRVQDVKSQFG